MDLSAPPYKASFALVALSVLFLATLKPAVAAPLKPGDIIVADFAEIDPSAGLVRVQATGPEGATLSRGRVPAMRSSSAGFKGTYALVGIGQGGIAASASVGILHCDGRGNVSGVSTVNLPGETVQTRRLAELSFQGNYTVQENGMSTLTTDQGIFDSIITQTDELVQEIALIQRELEPTTGNLLTLIGTRLPDEGAFTNASLTGTYVMNGIGRGGNSPVANLGLLRFDGGGNFSGSDTVNLPGAIFTQRTPASFSFQGSYQVDASGRGTATSRSAQPDGTVYETNLDFVITKALVSNGVKLAQEVFFIARELAPVGGVLRTVVGKRRNG